MYDVPIFNHTLIYSNYVPMFVFCIHTIIIFTDKYLNINIQLINGYYIKINSLHLTHYVIGSMYYTSIICIHQICVECVQV